MNSNNVIVFPKESVRVQAPQSLAEVHENLGVVKHEHIQETIAIITPILFNNLFMSGFSFEGETPEEMKDAAFVVESIRAMLCKHYDIEHPFQKIADAVFIHEGDGALKVVDALSLSLKLEEVCEEE